MHRGEFTEFILKIFFLKDIDFIKIFKVFNSINLTNYKFLHISNIIRFLST